MYHRDARGLMRLRARGIAFVLLCVARVRGRACVERTSHFCSQEVFLWWVSMVSQRFARAQSGGFTPNRLQNGGYTPGLAGLAGASSWSS